MVIFYSDIILFIVQILFQTQTENLLCCETRTVWHTTYLLRGSYMHRLSSSTIACHFLYGTTFATTFVINSTCMSSEWSRHNCYCLWSWAEWKLYFRFIYRCSLYPEIRVIHIFHICENKYANHFVLHFACTKGHSWVVDALSLYVKIPKLEIQPRDKVSWLMFVMIFLSPSIQMLG
jgi:hypothetical protein